MSTMRNLVNGICLCLTMLSEFNNSLILEQHNDERIHRQGYHLDNNCTNFDDPTVCNAAVELTNRLQEPGTSENGCLLPPHPVFGTWSIYGTNSSDLSPGNWASTGTAIQVRCEKGYKLDGNLLLACIRGNWTSDMEQCLKTCPPRLSSAVTKIICIDDGTEKENCTDATDGTIAKYECAPFYENANSQNDTHVCRYGAWSHPHFECTPRCGKKTISAQAIDNGTTAQEGAYPWQVVIYSKEKKDFICAGTLISQRIVLTNAYCVTESNSGRKPIDSFIVGAGKHYSKYDDPRDRKSAQFSSLNKMYVNYRYNRTSLNLRRDVAVLLTTKKFTLSQRVQLVCVDWSPINGENYSFNISDILGYIAGWGFINKTGPPTEELQEIKIPLLNYQTCWNNHMDYFSTYFTRDKLCTDYLNQSTSTCLGHTGSGVFVDHNGIYYLTGILSANIPGSPDGCNSQYYPVYTIVNYHPYVNRYRSFGETQQTVKHTRKCSVPHHPNDGRLSILGSKLSPNMGDTVPSGAIVQLTCNEFYVLQGTSTVTCGDGEQWEPPLTGTCLAPCPPLWSSRSTEVSCHGANCTNPIHGTVATFKCSRFYENVDLNINPFRTCQNGQWGPVGVPRCVPECGVKPKLGNQPKNWNYPWNAAIYKRYDDGKKRFFCAGTLVNERIILTSAQCVCDVNGKAFSPTVFEVVLGESHEDYGDREDVEAQFSKLEEIFVPDEYKGMTRKYWADVAVLITKKTFNMTERVQLLCLDLNNTFVTEFKYPKIQGHIAAPYESQVSEIEVPFVNDSQCNRQFSEGSKLDSSYYTFDKLCSGYITLNKTSSCNLNWGAGLVSKNRHDNRYYVTGIASVFPANSLRSCDKYWVLFTEVSKYVSNFISEKNKLYTPLNTPYFQTFCGIKSVQAQTLIVDGNNVTKGDYPWQVAIYRAGKTNKVLVCGGTLINQRIILTAAHCMTDRQGNKRAKELYIVAVGKYYRNFNHPDDKTAQFSALIDIFVSNLYEGELQNYVGDIAMLITEKSFVLSREVMPICLDWENKYEGQILRPHAKGYVAGWGFMKENDDPSEILKDLEVPYIDKNHCKEGIPDDYELYLTYDKMCAGYLNKSKSICRGDSGGGLVFKNDIDDRYYLTGIVSLSPQAPMGGCDSQQYTLFTKVSHYMKDFVTKQVQMFWR